MKRAREWIAGYLLILPIIAIIGTFIIYPIVASVYYSFTNYNPLRQMEYKNTFNLQDQLEQYLLVFSMKDLNTRNLISQFDPVDFVETQLGIKVNSAQKSAIEKYFDSKKLIDDFVSVKTNERINGTELFSRYMTKDKDMFTGYVPAWIGFQNFLHMINDSLFWTTLWNSVFFAIVVTPVQTFLALILAVAVNQKIKGIKFFKLSFYIPSVTSSAAISMLFMLLYAKPGLINRISGFFGIPAINWLSNTSTALPAVMAMNVWTTAGYFMIVFLAGLQNIPKDLIEASELDGAIGWTRFWKIIMPLLRPQISYVVTLGLIGTLQVFDQIYFLIQNQQNYTTAMYIYVNAFNYNQMGYASAIAVFFLVFIMILTLIQRRFVKEESYF